jgi:tetratricopeptide (TPR) repeat protein
MMGPSEHHRPPLGSTQAVHFGAFLKVLRHSSDIKQVQVLAVLPGWTQTSYSRLESDELAPAFDQLAALYAALRLAGVQFTPFDRHQFVTLARQRIEAKRSHQEHKSEQAWDELRLQLARGDHQETSDHLPAQDHLLETRHLVGREEWLQEVLGLLQGEVPKKLLVLQGPIGSGKSSELHRLARSLLSTDPARPHLVLCELPAVERDLGAESALDMFLATVLAEVGTPGSAMPLAELSTRVAFVLETLATTIRPTVLLLDNAEHLLEEHGTLATCWQQFLSQFLRRQHRASLVLATREWPGWFEGERLFVAEMVLPPLSEEMGVVLLQHLGLIAVATEHLRKVSAAVGGIPLCLEWVASLVQEPLLFDIWDEVDALDEDDLTGLAASHRGSVLTQRLLALLEDPSLFGGPIASKLTPLLQRILDHRLSPEAGQVLNRLAIANIPLGKPALQVLCPRPSLLKELRSTSLLAATAQRAQIVPMVAALLRARLSMQQQHDLEEQLIPALTRWLDEGKMSTSEAGGVVAELAMLYLKQHRLLEAAELLLYHGWLSFHQGYALRLTRLVQRVLSEFNWHAVPETESGGLLLYYYLMPYIGLKTNAKERAKDHHRILDHVLMQRIAVEPLMEVHLIHILMLDHMNENRFEQAQNLLEACFDRKEILLKTDFELHAMLLSKRAWLLGKWSDYIEGQGLQEEGMHLRGRTIASYEYCMHLLYKIERTDTVQPLRRITLKKKIAGFANTLSYHLNRMNRFGEALLAIEQCIELEEQGYVEFGALAAAYGEKSQILAGLGLFREALRFDEKARAEVQRCADTGDTTSQEEIWIYKVNQGCLYLRLGRTDKAEQLLHEAIPHIVKRRNVYRRFAEEALMEIEQMRHSSHSHQLDWRWIERYRELDAYDAYWWWAQAGPFHEEEQHQWKQLFSLNPDEAIKDQLGTLLIRSRDREVEAALAQHREPRLWYPTLDIEEVRRRIAGFLQLDAEIQQHEPNAIVRRLYHGTIEDELSFIRALEATYEGKSERFWDLNRQLNPPPTHEEMTYALSRVRQIVRLGFQRADTVDVSKKVDQILREQLHLNLSDEAEQVQLLDKNKVLSSVHHQRMVSAHAAKCFFETTFQEAGFQGWRVVLDSDAGGTRIDSALRVFFLPNHPLTLETVRDYFVHELVGHVSRSAAGEHSPLGLLGINTKGYAPTEEGLAFYYERTVADLRGEAFDDSGSWLGGLAIGLASGIVTPPQTFSSLFMFFEPFLLLYRLLWRDDEDRSTAEKQAHQRALSRCLRTFRGVPDLKHAGICYTRDVVYLRGRLKIEQAVKQDETILDRLAVGKVALELLPDLQELGIVASNQSLRKRAYDPDLDIYILSFDSMRQEREDF